MEVLVGEALGAASGVAWGADTEEEAAAAEEEEGFRTFAANALAACIFDLQLQMDDSNVYGDKAISIAIQTITAL